MSTQLSSDELLKQAIELPEAERAAFAATLIESLDGEPDPDAEAAWAAEIKRRLDEIKCGEVKLIPWEQARSMMLSDEQPQLS